MSEHQDRHYGSESSSDRIGNSGAGDREESPTFADAWLSIQLRVRKDRPELLQGLERWIELGLIEPSQLSQIARQHLSCPLPLAEQTAAPDSIVAANQISKQTQVEPARINPLVQIMRSFLDELSIRWLLFLGIFLVVVSSTVLAASQWQNFLNYAQYLVLLVYTLAFWGTGWWTARQSGLRLTSQTLSAIAILLIPINFWTISRLNLGQNLEEWVTIGIAALALLAIGHTLNRGRSSAWWLFWLLSLLQLGGQVGDFPLLAIYGGMGAIVLSALVLRPNRKVSPTEWLYIFAAWSLLLLRQSIAAPNFIANYCLAIAILVWLVGSLYFRHISQIVVITIEHKSAAVANSFFVKIVQIVGIILFGTTWIISVRAGLLNSALFFWHTVGISALAIDLLNQRLRLYSYKRDLTAIFAIGLQMLYVSKELIPPSWRSAALNLSVAISKTAYFPESVLGITLFPYVILFVFIASWFYRRQKRSLARHAEYLTLILGLSLTALSWSNPTWRSLNLLLSTLTLGYVTRIRRPLRTNLFYLTHLLGAIAVVNAISVIFTDLTQLWWGIIFTVLAGAEWCICLIPSNRLHVGNAYLNRSCWYAGWFFSAVSYTCLFPLARENLSFWGLIWLANPAFLSAIANLTRRIRQRRLATIGSCCGLVAAQLLFLTRPETRTIALLAAVALMFVNSFNLRRLAVTIVHVGFALGLLTSVLDLPIGDRYVFWLPTAAIAVLLLYWLRLRLVKMLETPRFGYISQRNAFGILGVGRETRNFKLVEKYIRAADYWAIALIALELLILSAIYFWLPQLNTARYIWQYLITAALLSVAVFWRYRLQPNNLVLYTLGWLGAILTTGTLVLFTNNSFAIAIGNILLGLAALLVIAIVAESPTWARLNLAGIPLVYASLGIVWRIPYFNAHTGWIVLGAAFIALNTRQLSRRLDRLVKYLSLAGLSWGIYELVIYQMLSNAGRSSTDTLTVLSLTTAAIAFSYRFIAWKYRQNNRATLFDLKLSQIVFIAHVHWAIGSVFKVTAAGITIDGSSSSSILLTLCSLATSFCLGAYAVIQGRDSSDSTPTHTQDWWVYVGLVEIAATLIYGRLIISQLSLLDPWRIIFTCAIALLIYQIPWQNLGWRRTPWQRTALVMPATMMLATAEISNLGLLVTALFYLRIAYAQRNIRWSYPSLGMLGWLCVRLTLISAGNLTAIAGIVSFLLLYIAQLDPDLQSQHRLRHYLRLFATSIFCVVVLLDSSGLVAGAIALGTILLGLGLRIRAFLYIGTATLIITVVHQLIILIFAYSFLKWVVGLAVGIGSIVVAAGFENRREQILSKFQTYTNKLQDWQ